jgi:phage virion morphogenesis protein
MAGTHQTIAIDIDERPVIDALNQLLRRTGDLEPAFRDIGEYLLISTRERFAAEQSPAGQPWAPLKPDYQARKPKNADKILVLEGYLENTLRYQTSPTELTFGSDRVYAAAQQYGRPEIDLPARPFLGLSVDDEREVLAILEEHLRLA